MIWGLDDPSKPATGDRLKEEVKRLLVRIRVCLHPSVADSWIPGKKAGNPGTPGPSPTAVRVRGFPLFSEEPALSSGPALSLLAPLCKSRPLPRLRKVRARGSGGCGEEEEVAQLQWLAGGAARVRTVLDG